MPPRTALWSTCRALAVRPRSALPSRQPFISSVPARRWYADDASTPPQGPPRPVNADTAKGSGESRPQSTDASNEAQVGNVSGTSNEVIDDATLQQLFHSSPTPPSDTDGGLTPAQEAALFREGSIPSPEVAEAMQMEETARHANLATVAEDALENPGHKFGMPPRPYPEGYNLKKRYHPVLEQISRLLMRDGKLSVAQRNLAMVINYLRTAPAPIYSPKFPLLPGTPPASYLPLNPILYLTIAIDSVAPLVKVKKIPKLGGGGRPLEMPQPLPVRQRRRRAFQWLLEAINKKTSKGSGRKQFPHRIAEEIIAVVEGRSAVWEKRKLIHKNGTAARANVSKRLASKKSK